MKILLVEDNPVLARVICSALQADDYAVEHHTDGTDGLNRAIATDYAAILLDLLLPGMDGRDVLRFVRRSRQTPILVLSALTDTCDRVAVLESGADDYLAKPFDLEELRARVRALIRRSCGHPSARVSVGPVTLDTQTHQLCVDGEPTAVTRTEYDLLYLLLQNHGRVVPRKEIYSKVFDDELALSGNTLDVHVSHLRSKVGRSFIRTIRGVGFIVDTTAASEQLTTR